MAPVDRKSDPNRLVPWPTEVRAANPKEGVSETAIDFITKARIEWARYPLEVSAEQYNCFVGQLQQSRSDLRDFDDMAWSACALIEPLILSNRFRDNPSMPLLRRGESVVSINEAYTCLCQEYGRLITFDDELPEFPAGDSDHWSTEHAVLHLLLYAGVVDVDARLDLLEGIIAYFWPSLQKVSDEALKDAKRRVEVATEVLRVLPRNQSATVAQLASLLHEPDDGIGLLLEIMTYDGVLQDELHDGERVYRLIDP